MRELQKRQDIVTRQIASGDLSGDDMARVQDMGDTLTEAVLQKAFKKDFS